VDDGAPVEADDDDDDDDVDVPNAQCQLRIIKIHFQLLRN